MTTDEDFREWNLGAIRRELDEALDTFETYADADQYPSIIAAYPDVDERSRLAKRLYDLVQELETLALAIWP